MIRHLFTAFDKKPGQTCPQFRADTSKSGVRDNFSGLTVKSLVRRVPDTCADTSGHPPPHRVRVGVSLRGHTPTRGTGGTWAGGGDDGA